MNTRALSIGLFLLLVSGFSPIVQASDSDTPPPPPKPECKDIVYRKWIDMLFVDNGNEEFVSYQWYKNHTAIPGATRQFYYTRGVVLQGDGNIYHAVATRADGSQVISCENLFEDFSASAEQNRGVQVRRAVLYTATGLRVGEWESPQQAPAQSRGCYVWQLTDNEGNNWTERVLY